MSILQRLKRWKNRETIKQKAILNRVFDIAEPWPADDLCPPPLDAQKAVYELCHYFLGEDWYIAMPVNTKQANSEIIYEIMCRFKGDRRYMKKLEDQYGSIQEYQR